MVPTMSTMKLRYIHSPVGYKKSPYIVLWFVKIQALFCSFIPQQKSPGHKSAASLKKEV